MPTIHNASPIPAAPPEMSFAASLLAMITGSTCGEACWHAREEVCRCSCGGKNHGCLNHGADRPGRTARIGGEFYELVAVVPGRGDGEAWIDAFRRTDAALVEVIEDRFPGIDRYAYGEYREHKHFPVVDRKVSASQLKWDEVKAVPNAYRLVWARPKGTAYAVKSLTPNGKAGNDNG